MKILLDTNVILDKILKRWDEEKMKHISDIFHKIENWNYIWCISIITISTLCYFLQKSKLDDNIINNLFWYLDYYFEIWNNNNKNIIMDMINSNFEDYEDAMQYLIALQNWCDIIITNNKKDFTKATNIHIYTIQEFQSL